jgi:hypothetical protein
MPHNTNACHPGRINDLQTVSVTICRTVTISRDRKCASSSTSPKSYVFASWSSPNKGLLAKKSANHTPYIQSELEGHRNQIQSTADRMPLLYHGTCRASGLYIRHIPPHRPKVLMHMQSQPNLDIHATALSRPHRSPRPLRLRPRASLPSLP